MMHLDVLYSKAPWNLCGAQGSLTELLAACCSAPALQAVLVIATDLHFLPAAADIRQRCALPIARRHAWQCVEALIAWWH